MRFYFETKRLILRDLLETDIDAMFELDSDARVHEYLGKKPITTKDKAAEIIQSIRDQYKERGIGRFAAIEKSSGYFIGWTGLKFNTGNQEAFGDKRDFYDIGYRFIPRYWGKGYATESSIFCLEYGFKELNIETMCGVAETENIASNKVLQKIGLKHLELIPYKDVLLNWYELKREDYER